MQPGPSRVSAAGVGPAVQAASALGEHLSVEVARAVLNSLTAHIAVLDASGRIIAVNSAWEAFAAANGNPALKRSGVGANYLDICRQAIADCAEQAVEVTDGLVQVLNKELPHFSLEYPCHSPTEKRWFLLHATPLSGEAGGAVIAHTPVTELRRVTEALRESERQLSLVLEGTSEGFWDWNVRTGHVFYSPRWIQSLGYAPDEVPPHLSFWESIVHPEDLPRARELLSAHFEGRLPRYRLEDRLRTKSGRYRWNLVQGKVVEWDSDARPLRMVGTDADISERKQAEEALRQSEERLKALVSTAADAIITIDEQGTIESANPAAECLFGYPAAEMIGQNVKMLMPSPHREDHDRYLADYLRTGLRWIIGSVREVQARRKDGTTFPVELAVSELGQPRSFTGILRDITRRKELEREILEIASLEQRRIGQELHDGVGQELTGLSLMADALSQRLKASPAEGKLAARLVEGIGRVHQQVRALSHGLVPVQVDPEGLRSALEELVARCREQSGISCTFEKGAPVHLADPATATHLYRIAQEAITNAIRHAQASHIRVALGTDSGHLTLTIQDDGVGMPAVFGEGRGLGIRLMRYRASLIGANLTIGPAMGGGTLVTCVLPRSDQHA